MNGLWMTEFNAGAAHGKGLAVFQSGELLGGDFAHTWTGTYQKEGSNLYARVLVTPFSMNGDGEKDVREQPFMITLAGQCDEQAGVLSGHPDESEVAVNIEMHKAA